MIVDSSALVAILRYEPDARNLHHGYRKRRGMPHFRRDLSRNRIVIDRRRDPVAGRRLDDLIADASIGIEPVTEAQAHIARPAYRD